MRGYVTMRGCVNKFVFMKNRGLGGMVEVC